MNVPPVTVVSPVAAELPMVVDSPHSGHHYPEDFGASLPLSTLRLGEDLFVDQLYANAPQHGATFIAANFPRVYIDPNRVLADVDEALLDAPWPQPLQPGPKSKLGIGLVWRQMGQQSIYQRRLSVAEMQRRIDLYWRPYQQAVDAAIEAAHQRFGAVWHLNVHSMPDDSYVHLGLPEKELADFVLGDLDGRTCSPELPALIEAVLRSHGYSVVRNDPFKGVGLIERHGRPAEQRHSLQVEVKRSLYADVAAYRPNEHFGRLRAALDAMLAAVAAHARRHIQS